MPITLFPMPAIPKTWVPAPGSDVPPGTVVKPPGGPSATVTPPVSDVPSENEPSGLFDIDLEGFTKQIVRIAFIILVALVGIMALFQLLPSRMPAPVGQAVKTVKKVTK